MLMIVLVDLMTGSFCCALTETAKTANMKAITNLMCLVNRKPSPGGFPFRDQDTGNPLDMAPKIWMWEVPMMPKDPTSAQGIHNQNAIDHVYLQAHNYPELHARIKKGKQWTSNGCNRSRSI